MLAQGANAYAVVARWAQKQPRGWQLGSDRVRRTAAAHHVSGLLEDDAVHGGNAAPDDAAADDAAAATAADAATADDAANDDAAGHDGQACWP